MSVTIEEAGWPLPFGILTLHKASRRQAVEGLAIDGTNILPPGFALFAALRETIRAAVRLRMGLHSRQHEGRIRVSVRKSNSQPAGCPLFSTVFPAFRDEGTATSSRAVPVVP